MAQDLLRKRLAKFTPPQESWTPVDEALYSVEDIYNVPENKAKKLREGAIKYSFKHHYENNKFYHQYCEERRIKPDDINREEDFNKIPLVPDTLFKSYPDDKKEFLDWLGRIYSGELPKIELKKKNPSYDDIIEELARKGVYLTFSTGTSGRFSFVPRDQLTYSRLVSSAIETVGFVIPYTDKGKLLPFPPRNTCIAAFTPNIASKNCYLNVAGAWRVLFEDSMYGESESLFLTDRPVTTEWMRIMLGRANTMKEKMIKKLADSSQKRVVSNYIKHLTKWGKEEKKLIAVAFPSVIEPLISKMEADEIKFHFEDGVLITFGGWKTQVDKSLNAEEFREKINRIFGLAEQNCRDAYAMNEMNAFISACEGHYKHIPYLLQPYVLDEEMNPLPYGEYGRFAFLDPLANSYPGFIVTSDRVKLLEHCPACSRPGVVLESEITRIFGMEAKGCAQAFGEALKKVNE